MENKNSYFYIEATTAKENAQNEFFIEKVVNSFDIILGQMNSSRESYIFKKNCTFICLFKTENRKRNGQLNKFTDRKFTDLKLDFITKGLKKVDYDEKLILLKRNKDYKILDEPESLVSYLNYSGKDLEIFNNERDWHSWQKQIYDELFDKNNKIKQASDRDITSIVDIQGNSGKSSFFKWLYIQNPSQIGRISYGSSSQLRSVLTRGSAKQIYIIDLPRTKGRNDNELDLLSAIEDLKTGFIINNMYGDGATLLMEPPHVIVSSNYILDRNALSKDRWKTYEIKTINNDKCLKKLTSNKIKILQEKYKKPSATGK